MEEPLYTVEDAMRVREFMDTCEYGQQIHICDGVDAVFIDAGHLLGSASIRLTLTGAARRGPSSFPAISATWISPSSGTPSSSPGQTMW